MVQVQEGQGGDGPGLEAELLRDDLLHAAEVGHGEAALADADELVGGCQVALLLRHFGCHVEAAEADAGQVLWLDLGQGDRRSDAPFEEVINSQMFCYFTCFVSLTTPNMLS